MKLPENLGNLYRHIRQILQSAAIAPADLEARRLIEFHTGMDHTTIIAKPEKELETQALKALEKSLARRLAGEPLARIEGRQEFWGLDFLLSSATLVPRPETEHIVELALARFPKDSPLRILDLGTGSGCLLVSILHEFPNAFGLGVDLSFEALKTAQKNAQLHAVGDRAAFLCGNWGAAVQGQFDLIVSNPPYIENHAIANLQKEVKNHDPILALDGGEDGLQAYRDIFSHLSNLFYENSLALFEVGYTHGKDVMRLAEESHLEVRGVHPDHAGIERVVEISCGDK